MSVSETKTSKVLKYMVEHGSITSLDAIYNFQATRLAAIIFCLKKKGFNIRTVKEHTNQGTQYARYILEDNVQN